MEKTYNKLVRDKIPNIIEAEGKSYYVERLSDEEMLYQLAEKIKEEANELIQALAKENNQDVLEELCDIQEAVNSLRRRLNINYGYFIETINKKAAARGRFDDNIFLVSIND